MCGTDILIIENNVDNENNSDVFEYTADDFKY